MVTPSAFTAEATAHQLVIDDILTTYWVYGDESAEAEKTYVLVHGFRGTHEGLSLIASALSGETEGSRVIVPDLPGFGQTGWFTAESGIAQYVSWVDSLYRELGLSGSVLVGHSFGSILVSAAVADGVPASRLVLINPISTPALEGPKKVPTKVTQAYYWLSSQLPQRAGNSLLSNPAIVRGMSVFMAKTRDPKLRKWIHGQHSQYFSRYASTEAVFESFEISIRHNVNEYIERIQIPLLILAGEKDDITRLNDQLILAEKAAKAEIIVYPQIGHLIHYEAPFAAAKAITRFSGMGS